MAATLSYGDLDVARKRRGGQGRCTRARPCRRRRRPASAWCSRTSTCSRTTRVHQERRRRAPSRAEASQGRGRARTPARCSPEDGAFRARRTMVPCELSGGQQQRVAIARALAPQPRRALLRRARRAPLDPELTQDVLKVIRDLAAEHMTMVIVTHEMNFARDVADRIVFMDGGSGGGGGRGGRRHRPPPARTHPCLPDEVRGSPILTRRAGRPRAAGPGRAGRCCDRAA